jgi:dienelactone hydrolase
VAHIALFHSVYGLRPAVIAAAERMRAAGHEVITPDLYAGPAATTIDEGFALSAQIGWTAIMRRALDAVRDFPEGAVLAGFSMGAGVVGDLLPDRGATAGLLLFHGIGGDPAVVRAGLPVALHIADCDAFFPANHVMAWSAALTGAGAVLDLYTYPNVGHFFTDPGAPDYNEAAADLVWERSLSFLRSL